MAEKTIQIADKPTLDEVKALLEDSGYGLEAIKEAIGGGSQGGGIKSIQSGFVNAQTRSEKCDNLPIFSRQYAYYHEFVINPVNINKSIIFIRESADGSSSYNYIPIGKFENESLLKIYFMGRGDDDSPSGNSTAYSWQVIEFN